MFSFWSSETPPTNKAVDDQRRSKASSCVEFPDLEKEESKENVVSVKSRRGRCGYSDSFSDEDLKTLYTNEECRADCSTSNGVPEDCPRRSSESDSNASTSESESQPDGGNNPQWFGIFRFMKKGPQLPFNYPPIPKFTKKAVRRFNKDELPTVNTQPQIPKALAPELYCFKASWINFSYSDILAATNNFSHECLIGEGGYAEVYKGKMKDGNFVAIKRLKRGNPEEMTADFLSELGIIVHVDHPNIARLIGYGVEGGMFLVLQLSPHGSLASILYGPREKLNWSTRFKIALGTAEGLQYLHEGCQRRIIHRDIKAANILLLEDFEPQVSDFGLAKWLPDQWTHHTIDKIEGTFGYLPPEFFMHGIVDEKTDVFAYGVLVLELITGRQALDGSQKSLVMWAKPMLSIDKFKELVDPCLADAYDEEQMKILALTAALCIDQSPIERPHMNQVVKTLKGDEESVNYLLEHEKSKYRMTFSLELFDTEEECNSTKCVSDVKRHMETLLSTPSSSFKEESIQN